MKSTEVTGAILKVFLVFCYILSCGMSKRRGGGSSSWKISGEISWNYRWAPTDKEGGEEEEEEDTLMQPTLRKYSTDI